MLAYFDLPEVSQIHFTEIFEGFLGRGLIEEVERMGQVVPDASEPVLTALTGGSEHVGSNTVENIVR